MKQLHFIPRSLRRPRSARARPVALALLLGVCMTLLLAFSVALAADISVTTTDDTLADDGLCSLREAVWSANTDSAIGGCTAGSGPDTIILGADTYLVSIPSTSPSGTPIDEGAIEISRSLTIQGAGAEQTVIQGTDTLDDRDALFRLSGSFDPVQVDVEIHEVSMQGAPNRAVIHFGDNLIIRDSNIMSNTGSGGILSGRGSTLTLTSAVVAHNASSSTGGGIQTEGTAVFSDVVVMDNQSASDGAGILVEGTLILNNSTVASNTSQVGIGGGIGPSDNNAVTVIYLANSTVQENQARRGGGIGTNGSVHHLIVDDSRIYSNTADLEANTGSPFEGDVDDGGGGIHSSGMMTITDSEIAHNTANNAGGGISGKGLIRSSAISNNTAFHGGGIAATGNLVIEDSAISQNRSTNDDPDVQAGGGGIAVRSLLATLVISNSTIAENQAGPYGGGVFSLLSHTSIDGSTVMSNSADIGGGIGTAGVMTLTNSAILDNEASERGAGIGNSSQLHIENARIASNVAGEIGGGIGNDGGTNFTLTIPILNIDIGIGHTTIISGVIENNRAERGAGIGTAGVFSLTDVIIRNNVAGLRGGGISLGNGTLFMFDSEIKGNSAGSGGGIYHTFENQYGDRASNTVLDSVTIRSNTAITEGGGLVVAGDSLTMTNSALYLNDAPVGAGLSVNDEGDGAAGTAYLEGSTLANSDASGNDGNCAVAGGAIVSEGGNSSSDTSCQTFLTGDADQNDVDVEVPDDPDDDPGDPEPDTNIYLPQVVSPE